MGFTAINTSVLSTPPENKNQHQPGPQTRHDRSDSVAAVYLGLGEPTINEALFKSTAKPSRGRGKKRTATTTSTASTRKSRKNKDHDTPTVSNSPDGAKEVDQSPPAAPIDPLVSLSPSWSPKLAVAKPCPQLHMTSIKHAQETIPYADSVSLYTPKTSMSETNLTSQSTSMDAFKASPGYGCIIYASSQRDPMDTKRRALEKEKNSITTSPKRRAPPRMSTARVPRLPPVREDESLMTSDVCRPKLSQLDIIDENYFGNASADEEMSRGFSKATVPNNPSKPSASARSNKTLVKSTLQAPTSVKYDDQGQISKFPHATNSQDQAAACGLSNDDDGFDLGDNIYDEAIDIVMSVEDMLTRQAKTPLPRTVKQNMRRVLDDEDYGGALLSESERKILESVKSLTNVGRKPIARRPFPAPILDRSPISGASNATTLRACFRIGETLNVGCDAVRHNKNVLIEFFARVTASQREDKPGGQQHLVFRDLFHDKPPYIDGTFKLWEQSVVWDNDSKPFLKADNSGIMCRAIAQMQRDGTKWRANVLNIWEATWADVEYTAGIYAQNVSDFD
ncbi:Hypothetical protein R9X50_00388700 [Acrodontium crateriforme]|uniref:Uncharacterized protein n=1 Tax=Acrodontium crateriforme TaxID=150365 RepID=A0AAQ3M9Z4_9PEZI|nr:Hypothetical protein R9X50_00388700 [Acrodontium crateriforme]